MQNGAFIYGKENDGGVSYSDFVFKLHPALTGMDFIHAAAIYILASQNTFCRHLANDISQKLSNFFIRWYLLEVQKALQIIMF